MNGWTVDGEPVTTWGRETTWFMPLKGLFADDGRADALLGEIDRLCADPVGAPANIEALSYLPDLFLRHGDADTAWRWMRHIYGIRNEAHEVPQQGLNGSYPEVSFTLVAQVIGLLGLQPNAAERTVTTRPVLPAGVSRLEAFDVPFGDGTIDVGAILDTAGPGTTAGTLWLRNGTSEAIRWRLSRWRRAPLPGPAPRPRDRAGGIRHRRTGRADDAARDVAPAGATPLRRCAPAPWTAARGRWAPSASRRCARGGSESS